MKTLKKLERVQLLLQIIEEEMANIGGELEEEGYPDDCLVVQQLNETQERLSGLMEETNSLQELYIDSLEVLDEDFDSNFKVLQKTLQSFIDNFESATK